MAVTINSDDASKTQKDVLDQEKISNSKLDVIAEILTQIASATTAQTEEIKSNAEESRQDSLLKKEGGESSPLGFLKGILPKKEEDKKSLGIFGFLAGMGDELKSSFDFLPNMFKTISSVIDLIFSVLDRFVSLIGKALGAIGKGIGDIISGIGRGLLSLVPFLTFLMNPLAMAAFAVFIAGIVGLGFAMKLAEKPLIAFANVIGTVLVEALRQIGAIMITLITTLPAIIGALTSITPEKAVGLFMLGSGLMAFSAGLMMLPPALLYFATVGKIVVAALGGSIGDVAGIILSPVKLFLEYIDKNFALGMLVKGAAMIVPLIFFIGMLIPLFTAILYSTPFMFSVIVLGNFLLSKNSGKPMDWEIVFGPMKGLITYFSTKFSKFGDIAKAAGAIGAMLLFVPLIVPLMMLIPPLMIFGKVSEVIGSLADKLGGKEIKWNVILDPIKSMITHFNEAFAGKDSVLQQAASIAKPLSTFLGILPEIFKGLIAISLLSLGSAFFEGLKKIGVSFKGMGQKEWQAIFDPINQMAEAISKVTISDKFEESIKKISPLSKMLSEFLKMKDVMSQVNSMGRLDAGIPENMRLLGEAFNKFNLGYHGIKSDNKGVNVFKTPETEAGNTTDSILLQVVRNLESIDANTLVSAKNSGDKKSVPQVTHIQADRKAMFAS